MPLSGETLQKHGIVEEDEKRCDSLQSDPLLAGRKTVSLCYLETWTVFYTT